MQPKSVQRIQYSVYLNQCDLSLGIGKIRTYCLSAYWKYREKNKKLMVQFVIEAIFESSNDIPKCNETLFGKIGIEMNMYWVYQFKQSNLNRSSRILMHWIKCYWMVWNVPCLQHSPKNAWITRDSLIITATRQIGTLSRPNQCGTSS